MENARTKYKVLKVHGARPLAMGAVNSTEVSSVYFFIMMVIFGAFMFCLLNFTSMVFSSVETETLSASYANQPMLEYQRMQIGLSPV